MKHQCSKCKEFKISDEFYFSKGKVNGWCKECFRQDHRKKYFTSKGQTDDLRNCRECNKEYAPKHRTESFFCSRDCKDKNRREENKSRLISSKVDRICQGCEKIIPKTARADKKWCSEECASKVRAHTMNTKRRIRTREEIQDFKRSEIYDRDGWICQLCKKKVDPTLTFPNPACASLDHVIPLSRGGSHKTTNVQLAHLRCNSSRGNRVPNLFPRPPLIRKQKIVFTTSEASNLIGVSNAVLDRAIKNKKVPAIQDVKFGSRYLTEKVVADLILTGVPGSLKWRREQPKVIVDKSRRANCKNCGGLFILSVEKRKYCSATCNRVSLNLRSRKKPSEIKCSICSRVLTDRKQRKKVNLCSSKCVNEHRRITRKMQAQEKFNSCLVCKNQFLVVRKPGHPSVTCSAECATELPRIRAREWHLTHKSSGQR